MTARLPRQVKTKHTNEGAACLACEQKLMTAHHDLVKWFREQVKPKHQDCHISDSWRGEIEQNQYVAEGRSKEPWPKSMHNRLDDEGNPCALALDLFELTSNGMACWSWAYFKKIADEAVADGAPIEWGGEWKMVDGPHFQLKIA